MNQQKYAFNEGIAIAYGATGSCIYDLRKTFAKIYRLDKDATELVRSITISRNFVASEKDRQFLSNLIEDSLLIVDDEGLKTNSDIGQTKPNLVAWIEVTEKCQLRCSYCYGSFGAQKQKTLSMKDVDLIFDQLSYSGFTVFRLIGGEPLLYKKIVKTLISKLSTIKNSQIELYTNGLLLTNEILAFFKDYDVKLAIGIFGATDVECANITGSKNILIKQKKIINLVQTSGVACRFSITRTETNSSASKEQLSSIYNFPVELLRQDRVKNIGRSTSSIAFQNSSSQRINKSHFAHKFPSSFIQGNISGGHSCYKNKICITASLDVHPCVMERSIVYGSLLSAPLVDVLKAGNPYMGASKNLVSTCRDCEYRYACFDCRVDRVSPDDFYSKSSNCGYNPHTGIWVE